MPQIENFLIGVLDLPTAVDAPLGEDAAMKEAEAAIDAALDSGLPIELSPQNSYVRRLQHQLAERYQLTSRSKGREPFRHVVIFPD
jgi:predicted RNA-binding protein Jag